MREMPAEQKWPPGRFVSQFPKIGTGICKRDGRWGAIPNGKGVVLNPKVWSTGSTDSRGKPAKEMGRGKQTAA